MAGIVVLAPATVLVLVTGGYLVTVKVGAFGVKVVSLVWNLVSHCTATRLLSTTSMLTLVQETVVVLTGIVKQEQPLEIFGSGYWETKVGMGK